MQLRWPAGRRHYLHRTLHLVLGSRSPMAPSHCFCLRLRLLFTLRWAPSLFFLSYTNRR